MHLQDTAGGTPVQGMHFHVSARCGGVRRHPGDPILLCRPSREHCPITRNVLGSARTQLSPRVDFNFYKKFWSIQSNLVTVFSVSDERDAKKLFEVLEALHSMLT